MLVFNYCYHGSVDETLVTLGERGPVARSSSAAAMADDELGSLLRLFLLTRGVLITPLHNMALMCPDTTAADVDRHLEVFDEALAALHR